MELQFDNLIDPKKGDILEVDLKDISKEDLEAIERILDFTGILGKLSGERCRKLVSRIEEAHKNAANSKLVFKE